MAVPPSCRRPVRHKLSAPALIECPRVILVESRSSDTRKIGMRLFLTRPQAIEIRPVVNVVDIGPDPLLRPGLAVLLLDDAGGAEDVVVLQSQRLLCDVGRIL